MHMHVITILLFCKHLCLGIMQLQKYALEIFKVHQQHAGDIQIGHLLLTISLLMQRYVA
jgi:hypothetical protein